MNYYDQRDAYRRYQGRQPIVWTERARLLGSVLFLMGLLLIAFVALWVMAP